MELPKRSINRVSAKPFVQAKKQIITIPTIPSLKTVNNCFNTAPEKRDSERYPEVCFMHVFHFFAENRQSFSLKFDLADTQPNIFKHVFC